MINENYLLENGVDLNSALELLGNISFYNQTLESYLEENKNRVHNIEKFREECNMPEYAILVHSLKSDAKYLGFTELADIAYEHEVAAKANDLETVNLRFKDLFDSINKFENIGLTYLSGGHRPAKVIVADESSVIRNIVTKAFEGKYEVLVASSGDEAIRLIQNNVYEDIKALILDLNMPGVDGFAVLDYFKENNLFDKIPVLIITGEVEQEKIDKALSYGVTDVIAKPFTLDSVRSAIEKINN